MTYKAKAFARGFATTTAVAVFLNLLPYLRTYGAFNSDGYEVIGFPLTFRWLGGFAGRHEFLPVALTIDILLGLLVGGFVGCICARIARRT